MPRAPDSRIDKAREMFLDGKKLIEIAAILDIPEGTIRSWKNRYKWDATLQKNERNVAKRKGGQYQNKNAAGHGGTGPPGNKNAVKTGEFEALFFDTLDPEEKSMIGTIPTGKEQLLLQEIQLLTVRERRMMKRIGELKQFDFTCVKHEKGIEKGQATDLEEHQATLGQIQGIEDALTRVQARKQKAIEALHRFGYDDARLEIEMMKVEMAVLKQGGPEDGIEDDGFLDAMGASAPEVWGEMDE